MSNKQPNVIFSNPNIVVSSIKEIKGLFGDIEFKVRYGTRQHPDEHFMTLSQNTRGGTTGVGEFKVIWN